MQFVHSSILLVWTLTIVAVRSDNTQHLDTSVMNTLSRPVRQGGCNFVALVNCYVSNLEEYTLKLWDNRINVVSMKKEDCEHINKMAGCIEHPEQFSCTKQDVMSSSKELTQLLIHRDNKSTFVKSYYLLKYACSDAGQTMLDKPNVRECLRRDQIGQSLLAAANFLATKYLDQPSFQRYQFRRDAAELDTCNILRNRITEYNNALSTTCVEVESGQKTASEIMCHSLSNMVRGVYSDKVSDECEIDCSAMYATEAIESNAIPTAEPNVGAEAGANGQSPSSAYSTRPYGTWSQLVASLFVVLITRIWMS